MSGKLYELAANYQKLIELDDEDLTDTLESVESALEVKVENIAKAIRILDAEENMYKKEAARLSSDAVARGNRAKRLREFLLGALFLAGKDRMPTAIGVVSRQKNPPGVNVVDDCLIPEEFFRIIPEKREVDKNAVLERLKAGEVVPGAELAQGYRLAIR
jgi:hypothetical protein